MAESPLGLTNEQRLAYYKLFASDLEAFARYFFPELCSLEIPQFHKEVYKDLLVHQYYACAAPRGHAKSSIGLKIKPIHFALFNRLGSDAGISLLSSSEDFIVNEITRWIKKQLESNQRLIAFFGPQKTEKWSETYFVLKNGVAIEGGGISGQLRGGRRGLICLDDLETNETVLSEDQRNKLRDRVNKELIPKLLPGGQIIYFGTLINQLSFLSQITSVPNNGWFKRVYDCYVDHVEAEGHELWPEMLPHKELQRRKSIMGTNAFQAEYRNNPLADEDAPIKAEQIRYWEEIPKQYSAVITVDPAYSEDSKADFKTASMVGMDQAMNRYLFSYIHNHAPIGEFQDAIINLWLQHKNVVTAIGVPNSGVEKSFFDSFMKRCEARKVFPPVVELKNSFTAAGTVQGVRNKKARITAALQPLFENGKYYINKSHEEARDELLAIGSSLHDDIVDTMAYAEQVLQPNFYPTDTIGINEERSNVSKKYEPQSVGDFAYGV